MWKCSLQEQMRAGPETKGNHLLQENNAFFPDDESDDDFDVCLDMLLMICLYIDRKFMYYFVLIENYFVIAG